jgi:sugar lactone lactonase YvrE
MNHRRITGWMRVVAAGLLLPALLIALAPGGSRAAEGPSRYVLPGATVFPEGIGYDAATNAFFVGSNSDGTLFRGDVATGAVTVFSPAGSDGRTSATGMKSDGRGHLIVAGAATGLIFVYDIATGALVQKFDTGSEPKTFLNDIAVTPDGAAYVTDSMSPYLYKLTPGAAGFTYERWLNFTGTAFAYVQGFNANGIVASDDGRYLLIVQSGTGKLFRVGTADKSVAAVDLGTATLAAGDGMWLTGHTLYVMRNAQALLVTLALNADYSAAQVTGTATDPALAYPTTFARVGDRFLVVNSQFDKRGPGLTPVLPFTVVSVPVPGAVPPPGMPTTGVPAPPLAALLGLLAAALLIAGRRLRMSSR